MPIIVDEGETWVEVGHASSGGTGTPPAPDAERQALIAECVEQVLEILRQEREP